MTPQGCLAAFFLSLLVLWSLMIGGLVMAGWLGAEIIEFVVAIVLADAQSAHRAAEGFVQTLRSIGFGVVATTWAVGAGIIALLWFGFARSARHAERTTVYREETTITIDAEVVPGSMKDVTPRPDSLPPPGGGERR